MSSSAGSPWPKTSKATRTPSRWMTPSRSGSRALIAVSDPRRRSHHSRGIGPSLLPPRSGGSSASRSNSPILRSAGRAAILDSSRPSRITASAPRNGRPARAATPCRVNGPQGADPLGRSLRHRGQKVKPALYLGGYRVSDLLVGPARRGHLHQHPDIARIKVFVEEITGLLPLLPQRQVGLVHGSLPGQPLLVLHVQHREHQFLLRSEVVVNLAQRHPRSLRDASCSQVRVTRIQERAFGRSQNPHPGVALLYHRGSLLAEQDRLPDCSVVRPNDICRRSVRQDGCGIRPSCVSSETWS